VCSNAARFVVSFVQEDGGIYKPAGVLPGGGGLSTYNTAICMTALHAYDRVTYAPVILAARKFMVGSQRLGDSPGAGGFSYEQTPPLTMKVIGAITGRGGRADLSNTGWSLQALRLTRDLEEMRPGGQVVDIDWPAALRFVDRLQNTDSSDPVDYGGFGYAGNSERGGTVASTNGAVRLAAFGSMTYAGLESLIYAQVDRRDPRIESAIQWTARHWSVDENPGMGTRGLFYYYAIMAKALSLTGSDLLPGASGTPIPWKKDLVEKLVKTQRADGSWVNEDNSYWEGDAALVTSYAALALESVLGR
jgi:squalene-hopene/tetraprenyl-beta-curcumene cyclase